MKEYIIQFDEEANTVPTFIKEQFLGLHSDRELIRCKDCKYYKTQSYQEGRYVFTFCERDRERRIYDMNGDDYCSKAERAEHETD